MTAAERRGEERRDEKEEQKQNKEELVEALLFIAGKFLSAEEIAAFCEVGLGEARAILENLVAKYEQEGAIKVVSRDNFFKMDVKPEYAFLINKIASGEAEFSKAEQETLAVIAHKKPVAQAIVIRIRGNKAYDHIKKFRELGLLNSKRAGRTYILDLSENFYNYFSIGKQVKLKSEKDESVI